MGPQYLETSLSSIIDHHSSTIVLLLATLSCLVLLLIRRPALGALCRTLGLADAGLRNALLARIDSPLQVLLIILALMPGLAFMAAKTAVLLGNWLTFVSELLAIHVLIQIVYAVALFWYLARASDKKVPAVVLSLIVAVVYLTAFLWLLNLVFGINVVPFLATSTVITAVLGLAMQDTLRNICAGLTISVERSFRQGDWVMFRQDQVNTLVGEVIEIGWRSTKIRSVNNNYIIIPNAQFTSNELINYNSPTPVFAQVITFPVSLTADGEQIIAEVEKIAAGIEGVLEKPLPQAVSTGIQMDHVTFQLRVWLGSFEVKEKVTGALIEAIRRRLIELNALAGVANSPRS